MKNFTYSGWKMNGFVALLMDLLVLAGSIYSFVLLGNAEEFVPWFLISGLILLALAIIIACGFMMLEPNEARVLLFFGTYKGTFYDTGYWWVNPFMSAKKLSLRARNLNVNPIKVNDKAGNPILIGLVLVWKIKSEGA